MPSVFFIDNQSVEGCTGGALWSDPFRPGPIYLQGDHTGMTYRNVVLSPVEKWPSLLDASELEEEIVH